jgi:heme/copper-type cytochrome/quinol oxidase subunit 2
VNSVTVSLWNLNISFKNRLLAVACLWYLMWIMYLAVFVRFVVCFLAFARRNNYNYNNYNYNEKVKITRTTTITRKLEELQLKL